MSNQLLSRLAIAAALASALACAGAQCVETTDGSGIVCAQLSAGQTIDAGNVCVEVVGTDLVVTYTTTDGWELCEAHLWVGNNLANYPKTKKGNPIPGQFPYNSGTIAGTSFAFAVPMASLGFACPGPQTYYLGAHAVVKRWDEVGGTYQTETGWSTGPRFVTQGNWATYSTFNLTCSCFEDTGGGDDISCETAWARASSEDSRVCLSDFADVEANRWGWSNGPYASGTDVTLDLWAAAAQCAVQNGTLVGSVNISYSGSTVTVTYNMSGDYTLDETHLYVGSNPVPTNKQGKPTVAPGQLGNIHQDLGDATVDSYTITGISGTIYVLAHAVACGTGL